jgi:hypothetical protein
MLTISKSANEKIILLKGISNIILNKKISHEELRDKIFIYIPEDNLRNIVNDCNKLIRPSDDHHMILWAIDIVIYVDLHLIF